ECGDLAVRQETVLGNRRKGRSRGGLFELGSLLERASGDAGLPRLARATIVDRRAARHLLAKVVHAEPLSLTTTARVDHMLTIHGRGLLRGHQARLGRLSTKGMLEFAP